MTTVPRPFLTHRDTTLTMACPNCLHKISFPCTQEQFDDVLATDTLRRSVNPEIPEEALELFHDGLCNCCRRLTERIHFPPKALEHLSYHTSKVLGVKTDVVSRDEAFRILGSAPVDKREELRTRYLRVLDVLGNGYYIQRKGYPALCPKETVMGAAVRVSVEG